MPSLTATRHEDGFTLVELLVVILLLGVIGGIVVSGLVTAMQNSQRSQERIHAMAELQRTAENVARELRAACPLEVADEDRAELVVARGGGLVEHRYYVSDSNNELRHEVDEQDGSGARTLVHDLAMNGDPVFEYRDGDGEPTSTSSEARAVVLTLRRTPDWVGEEPIDVRTAVQIRNGGRSCQ